MNDRALATAADVLRYMDDQLHAGDCDLATELRLLGLDDDAINDVMHIMCGRRRLVLRRCLELGMREFEAAMTDGVGATLH